MKRKKEKLTNKLTRWCIGLAWFLFIILMGCDCENLRLFYKIKLLAAMYGLILYIITKKLAKFIQI